MVTRSVDAGVSVPQPRPVSPVRPSTSTHTHVHTHRETIRDRDNVNINTLNTSNVASGSSFVREEHITSATVPKVQVQDKIVVPSQTLLIQQPPMYYAAAPMYVVEPKPQMVLVAGGTQQTVGQVPQVGLSQGLVQVGGLQSTQGVVLVDRHVGAGGVKGQVVQGPLQGHVTRSKQVVIENVSSGGERVVQAAQGFVQTGLGFAEHGFEARGQGIQMKSFSAGSHGSIGSNDETSLSTPPKSQGSQRVVVQRKKVSVIERNNESSPRA